MSNVRLNRKEVKKLVDYVGPHRTGSFACYENASSNELLWRVRDMKTQQEMHLFLTRRAHWTVKSRLFKLRDRGEQVDVILDVDLTENDSDKKYVARAASVAEPKMSLKEKEAARARVDALLLDVEVLSRLLLETRAELLNRQVNVREASARIREARAFCTHLASSMTFAESDTSKT